MNVGIRCIIGGLLLTHVLLLSAVAFCHAQHPSGAQSHSASTHPPDAHPVNCDWACQMLSTPPTLAATTPLLCLPHGQHQDCFLLASQPQMSLALQALSPRAPPA